MFGFDRVFDGNTTQSDVYEGTTKNLLDSVLDGYNATVFAYGATGCGKTHTITGTAQQPGIIFLTMQELFEKIEDRSQDKSTELSLSYLEIYNETIRDLLVPGGSKAGLMLREDSNQAVTVTGLTSHHPKDVQEVMDIIVQGNEYRTVSPTEANATSSRSHAVLQINIAQKDRNAGANEPHTMATLSIIDLAGSERASVTKNRGERLTEGANINKSLLALGSCINALCDRRGRAHVPYRNSKLTRLLKFSLGGNCKTVMIVCVSPSSAHFDESQNTLRYANRAKNIQTKVTRNVFNVNRHVKDFLVKINEQMALINELKAQQKDAENIFFVKFQKQHEKRDATTREGIQRLRAAYDNCSAERQERINSMKKLKIFERRIALLTGWIAAFETVCEQRGNGEDGMPANLCAIRRTANGILVELEDSRYHIHQKLEKSTWEHHIDTALSHSVKQLEQADGADMGEVNNLNREAELLKTNFMREAYREVLEQEKVGDAGMVQTLLTAQFDMLACMSDTLAMDEASAVSRAKEIINRLLSVGFAAVGQVVKPEGGMSAEMFSSSLSSSFSSSRRSSPRRKQPSMSASMSSSMSSSVNLGASMSMSMSTNSRPMESPALELVQEHIMSSPARQSPRRRKVLGTAKKGVTFTPVKKNKQRGVRWRDDEDEDGTLADFEKTPKRHASESPEEPGSEQKQPMIPSPQANNNKMPAPVPEEDSFLEESTLVLEPPQASSLLSSQAGSKPGRFQAGFLSKNRNSLQLNGSPSMPSPPKFSLSMTATPSDASPLRSLDVAKSGNMSPPPAPRPATQPSLETILDENCPPSHSKSESHHNSASGSDSESNSSLLDPKQIRSAMHSAKKEGLRRNSVLSATAASAGRRASSAVTGERSSMRASVNGNLASSTSGISRNRRGSLDRKRSPMVCSPEDSRKSGLTAGQARRMNLGGSVRVDGASTGSPPEGSGPRRVTISTASVQGHKRQESRGAMR